MREEASSAVLPQTLCRESTFRHSIEEIVFGDLAQYSNVWHKWLTNSTAAVRDLIDHLYERFTALAGRPKSFSSARDSEKAHLEQVRHTNHAADVRYCAKMDDKSTTTDSDWDRDVNELKEQARSARAELQTAESAHTTKETVSDRSNVPIITVVQNCIGEERRGLS